MRPTVSPLAEQLYDELAVAHPGDELRGWPLLILLHGIATTFGTLAPFVLDSDESEGWTAMLDPVRAPAWGLPWLAQMAGVRLTPGYTDDQHRQEIVAHAAFQRGTAAAIRAAAQGTLSGTRLVALFEQDGSPYRLTAITRNNETPDPAATLAALLSQKPAGLVLTHVVSLGMTWAEATSTWDSLPAGLSWDDALMEPV